MTAPVQQDQDALETARELARAGIPVFAAPPDDSPVGFRLPSRWQQTEPDPARADEWQPGWAMCAVMGRGLDLVDLDLYAGADVTHLDGLVPRVYGSAQSASGGLHLFVATMGVRSKNGLFKGIDIKAGDAEGKGRGFAFIAPTVKKSKSTGQPGTYIWVQLPDTAGLAHAGQDTTGAALAAVLTAKKTGVTPLNGNTPAGANGSSNGTGGVQAFMSQQNSPWADIEGTLRAGRNDGVMRLAASLREREAWDLATAIAWMREQVWPRIDQGQSGHEFSEEEFEAVITAVWRQYPGPAEHVQQAAQLPDIPGGGVDLTDAYLVDRVAYYVLGSRYAWASGLGWLRWDSKRWETVTDEAVHDAVRGYFIWLHAEAARAGCDHTLLGRLSSLLSRARIAAVTALARGHPSVYCRAADFDAHPDLLNTPAGVVDLRTGDVNEHDPGLRLTKITSGNYRPGYTHPDWQLALTALDETPREWLRSRLGQAITGWPSSDGVMPVLQGSGENGKTCLTTDGPVVAFGDYAQVASPKLITSQQPGRSEHSTEMADLRGQRLLIGEELSEGRSIDVTALKRIQDVGMIKARYVHRDNISFPASHTLLITSNYIPVIAETDHGTWRRLALLRFPYTFRKPGQPCDGPLDRPGDPELKSRLRRGESGQHDAIVTWVIDGAKAWYERGMIDVSPPPPVAADTLEWRISADRILGFWLEHLEADHGSCILATEMLDAFNAWIGRNGHAAWARETFAPRFAAHEETARNGVEERRTTHLEHLSRWPYGGLFQAENSTPKQATAWLGVRWKTDADQAKNSRFADLAHPQTNVPSGPTQETFAEGSARPASKITKPGASPDPVAEVAEPRPDTASDQAPAAGSPPDAEPPAATERKQKVKPRKREGPDPELTGPVLALPALVLRDGQVISCSLADAAKLAAYAELTVDVETAGYPVGHPFYALRTVQLGDERIAVVFDAADPEQQTVIRDVLAGAQVLHAHSAAADLVPLQQAGLCGMSAWDRMADTVIPAKLADPAMSGSDADALKELAGDVLGDYAVSPGANEARKKLFASGGWLTETKALTEVARSGWAQVDSRCETMIRYAASDVLDTAALARVLPAPDPVIAAREQAVQAMCARVSHRGLQLDAGHIAKLIAEHTAGKADAGERVNAAGIDNPGSAQQVGRALAELGVILPRTRPSVTHPDGQPSAAEAVLAPLAAAGGEAGQLAGDVLAYRDHATVLGLTLEPFRLFCEHGDARVRPVIYTLGTDTGRMSCVRPNLQQLKRTGGLRACITADDGMVIISADFQAVELRTAAALAGDENLYRMILEGDDLHWKIARQVWGQDATKAHRYNAKRGVFGRLYGAGIPKIATTLGISETEARAVADTLDALAPGVARWSAGLQKYVRDGGTSFTAYSGRVIWLDRRQPHKGANYCIQGTAREFLADGMLRWKDTRWGDSVLLPVHDEVLAVVVTTPGADQASVQRDIARILPAGAEVVTGRTLINEQTTDINQALSVFSTALVIFALIALFVGGFTIFNTFSITVGQRTRELALLRIVGASRRQVFRSVLAEAAIVGLVASVVGLGLGVLAAKGLVALLSGFGVSLPSGSLVFSLRTVIVGLVVGIGVTVISAISPARRAVRIPPVAALPTQMAESEISSGRRGVVGGGCVVVGVAVLGIGLAASTVALVGVGAVGIFIGVGMLAPIVARPMASAIGRPVASLSGVSGRLGRENSMRNPRRTAQTAAALMVGLALVSAMSVFGASLSKSTTNSIDNAVSADLVVTGPSSGFPNRRSRPSPTSRA